MAKQRENTTQLQRELQREIDAVDQKIAQHYLNLMHAELEMAVRLLRIRQEFQTKLDRQCGLVTTRMKAALERKLAELGLLKRGTTLRRRRSPSE